MALIRRTTYPMVPRVLPHASQLMLTESATGVTIKPRHRVIQSSHPSPNSHKKTTEPFTGSRCFSLANAKLRELQQAPVDWNLA